MNEFHTLLAQVIPVLLLAAAFESKWLQRIPSRYGGGLDQDSPGQRVHSDTNPFQPVGQFLLVAYIGVGEALALFAVFTGSSQTWQNAWVLLAGILSLLLVIAPLMALHWRDTIAAFRQGFDWSLVVTHVVVVAGLVTITAFIMVALASIGGVDDAAKVRVQL
ncbi:hypothetical protein [Pseudarthrobacter oxydans]|uniref:hypothetical protein n=1 Tax=Pseudarthrobacter oxydans TaxID=1671 RepID=UPI002AA69616|nr:hypothetical protein [Pseudarthrobacter oxydans]WPU08945.1 hypothetical protein SMD14_17655 [Pseudarthrobacter oxydans]